MSKSRACAEKVVRIAKQNGTRKTNLLVYERENAARCQPQPTPAYVPPIANVQAKRIKICTGAELKKMCAPPPCPCPPKAPSPTFLQRLWRLLGFGLKALIALGAVYVTYDMGIWGDSDSTRRLYRSICDFILPQLVEPTPQSRRQMSGACEAEQELFGLYHKDPFCCDKFPVDHESGVYELQQKWNRVVVASFSVLAAFPHNLIGFVDRNIVCKLQKRESCEPKDEDDEAVLDCIPCDDEETD